MARDRIGTGRRVAAGAAAAVAAAAAAVVADARRGGSLGRRLLRRGDEPGGATMWSCACGERLRTVGVGRHQVHWLAEAPEDEPLLEDTCPACGRPLALAA